MGPYADKRLVPLHCCDTCIGVKQTCKRFPVMVSIKWRREFLAFDDFRSVYVNVVAHEKVSSQYAESFKFCSSQVHAFPKETYLMR